jgi:hypothetical protein
MDDGKKIMAEFEDNWDKEIEKLTEEQIDNYYKKGITDGLSDEQRAYLYFKPDAELYAEVMGAEDFTDNLLENQVAKQDMPDSSSIKAESMATNAMEMDEEDFMKQIETKNNIPKGSISKLGLALDPIAEGLEFALKGIGLGSIANWWVKAEAANFLAGLIRGAGAASGVAQLGQSQALMGEEFTADADAIKNAFAQNLSSQMKLSPSLWMENKYAESNLGKGKTPSQQGYEAVKNALKLGK